MKKILLRTLYIPLLILSFIYAVITLFSGISVIVGLIRWIVQGGELVDYISDFSLFLMDKCDDLKIN